MNIDKTFIIGDVHGCYHTLVKLLEKIPQKSRIIFVGDLVDKGKYSKDVIELVLSNNYEVVLGNHEYLMYNYIKEIVIEKDHSCDWYRLKGYGGKLTVDSYKNDFRSLAIHLSWIETLPRYIQIGKYFITHGFGLPYFQRKDNSESKHPLFSNRINDDGYKDDWEDFESYDVINIFGHCVFKNVLAGDNYYGIDTGCAYGNKLSAIELGTHNIIEQKALGIDLDETILEKKGNLLC